MNDRRFKMEIEVEYTHREKIEFIVDPDEGVSRMGVPREIGRFLHSLQYHLHSGKDLTLGEKPRLLSWNITPRRSGATLECGCWTYKVAAGQSAGQIGFCPEHGDELILAVNVEEPDESYFESFGLHDGYVERGSNEG